MVIIPLSRILVEAALNINHYELEKFMEMRVKEALDEARQDAMAREILRVAPEKPNKWLVWFGNLMIGVGSRLAASQAVDYSIPMLHRKIASLLR